jgi:conjugative transfer signal peptidase TraF
LVGLGLLIAANVGMAGVRFNWTASAPIGLYAERPLKLTRGELVLLCLPPSVETLGRHRGYLPAGECHGRSSPVLKQLVGLPGDTIALDESLLTVNGAVFLQTPIQALDSAGRPLPHAPFGSRVLPAGQVWVLGVNSGRSWDSRYFGPIPIESLMGSVRPVLTINLGHP